MKKIKKMLLIKPEKNTQMCYDLVYGMHTVLKRKICIDLTNHEKHDCLNNYSHLS